MKATWRSVKSSPQQRVDRVNHFQTRRLIVTSILCPALVAGLGACATNETSPNGPVIEIEAAGASSQSGAMEAWIASFQLAHPNVTINYTPSGSGAGRNAFINGGVDFAGSDVALNPTELSGSFAACQPGTKAIDLPVYISPIAVIFNINGVDELNLDARTIARIFTGEITRWDDPAIRTQNPHAKLPSATITAVHRSDDSGTTKNFTDYLHQNAPDVWEESASDKFPYLVGEAAQGTSGVVDAVANGTNTIGYADASRAAGLANVRIKVGEQFVSYTPQRAAEAVAGSPLASNRGEGDIVIELDRKTTNPNHYPIVLVSYLIGCVNYDDKNVGQTVREFLNFVASSEGQKIAARSAGAAPVPEQLANQILTSISRIG